jgi:uncharacterized protein (DUF488 family)
MMKLFTIGFTGKKAEQFFTLLQQAGVRRVLDIRLNNQSQLAGFAKRDDLAFFLKRICQADYRHLIELAPSKALLDDYKNKRINWQTYEHTYRNLLVERRVERLWSPDLFEDSCLLCSEHTPAFCHRRLAAEYLSECWNLPVQVEHLQ